ncbi:MAG: hypothetical protein QW734_08495 [Candidatus Bathyarchaeia archaeon]
MSDQATRTIDEYLIPVDFDTKGIPVEVYIAFKSSMSNESLREKIREMWMIGNRYDYAHVQCMLERDLKAIFKPRMIGFDLRNNVIHITMPSNITVAVDMKMFPVANPEQICDILRDYILVEFDNRLHVYNLTPLRGNVATDIAGEILADTTPIEALILGLGYRFCRETVRLLLPRLLTWFKYLSKPIHVFQQTRPNTGKTQFGLRSETLLNYEYINEVPSLARLVFDGNAKALGAVFLSEGIILDEVNRWTADTDKLRKMLSVLQTGMEQGKWTRGVTLASISFDTYRHIPFLFLSNEIIHGKPFGGNRLALAKQWSDMVGDDMSPIVDRLFIVDICHEEIPITEYLTYKYLPDSIMRGIVKIVQDNVKKQGDSALKGRQKKQSEAVCAVCKALGLDLIEQPLADMIVEGTVSIGRVLDTEKHEKPAVDTAKQHGYNLFSM